MGVLSASPVLLWMGAVTLSAIPNPFFDVAGLTAGALQYPPHRYWIAVALGKSVVYTVIATVGERLFNLFSP